MFVLETKKTENFYLEELLPYGSEEDFEGGDTLLPV